MIEECRVSVMTEIALHCWIMHLFSASLQIFIWVLMDSYMNTILYQQFLYNCCCYFGLVFGFVRYLENFYTKCYYFVPSWFFVFCSRYNHDRSSCSILETMRRFTVECLITLCTLSKVLKCINSSYCAMCKGTN